ncbi:MAG: S46 family peptidase [Bacteroidia bacterium]|nr:S46 family peptidase [Bacteroidia bacterium]
MFKKIVTLAVIISFIVNLNVKADEGMWLLTLLNRNYDEMKKAGFKLTPEDIYSINKSCMKDAIIQFGNGCTGSVISAEGLLITNHHCGYGQIQANSTLERNYLEEGFWAIRRKEELPNDGLTVKFLIRIEDVTAKILADVNNSMTEKERNQKIAEESNKISEESSRGTEYSSVVRSLFEGNSYYLFVYLIYKDVRLVGAPPSSIGKFGGDTDNWMWPRQTGDFCLFRIYTAPDGKPAEYALENVPLKAKNFLPVSLNGVKKEDFTMILGYPGSTNRYFSSFGVKQATDIINPAIVKIREAKLAILRETIDKSNALKIKYAAKYYRTSNYWKYFIGQTKGLNRLNVFGKRKELETQFQKWADENSDRKALYGSVIADMESANKALEQYNLVSMYFREATLRGPDGIAMAHATLSLYELLKKADTTSNVSNEFKSQIMEAISDVRKESEVYFKDFDLDTEKKLFSALFKMFYTDIKPEFHPDIFKSVAKDYKGDFNKFANAVFKKSIFSSEEKFNQFLTTTKLKKLTKDPLFLTMQSLLNNEKKLHDGNHADFEKLDKANRLFLDGLMKMQSNKLFYPNANGTMRLTYGKVLDYIPRDAVAYDYFTTLKGVMQKEDETDPDFDVPAKLKELYKKKDYGRYAQDGEIRVCFTTNNDITGGNSGSPVLNGNGELVGLAFDGNWEAMSGDIAFEPDIQRTIVCDIRYVLFIIDKFAGAQNLIKEITVK